MHLSPRKTSTDLLLAINFLWAIHDINFVPAGRPCAVSDNNLFYSALMYFSYFVLFARLNVFPKRVVDLSILGSSIKPISASQKGEVWKRGRRPASHNSTELRSALEMSFRPVANAQRRIIQRIKHQRRKKVRKTQFYRPKKKRPQK